MTKFQLTLLCGIVTSALLAACASVDSFVEQADEASAPITVTFNYGTVTPQTVTIPASGNVTWMNLSLDDVAFVILPGSIAASFRCTELRPWFTLLEDGRYRSQPLTGTVSERAQLPCALAPGAYDYEVWLMGQGFGDEGIGAAPQKVLHATLVVSPPAPPAPAAWPARPASPTSPTSPTLPGGY